jgi:hypothetical protein
MSITHIIEATSYFRTMASALTDIKKYLTTPKEPLWYNVNDVTVDLNEVVSVSCWTNPVKPGIAVGVRFLFKNGQFTDTLPMTDYIAKERCEMISALLRSMNKST